MRFYDVSTKSSVDVPSKNIRHMMTKNGRHMCVGMKDNRKFYKMVSAEEAMKYPKMK